MVLELNSLNKNYTEIENENQKLKLENTQLRDIIEAKNHTILDFQSMFEASKSKLASFEQTNTSLKARIAELEGRVKNLPESEKKNEDL